MINLDGLNDTFDLIVYNFINFLDLELLKVVFLSEWLICVIKRSTWSRIDLAYKVYRSSIMYFKSNLEDHYIFRLQNITIDEDSRSHWSLTEIKLYFVAKRSIKNYKKDYNLWLEKCNQSCNWVSYCRVLFFLFDYIIIIFF